MIGLSKSEILSHQQCPKRLWLEKLRPELAEVDAGSTASMSAGHEVGEIAQQLFPGGILIDADDLRQAVQDTQDVLASQPRKPIYEAAFQHEGVLVRADILLPESNGTHSLIEVKSATSVKDYYYNDVAVQTTVTEAAGIKLKRIELAHIDNTFVYPGNEDYHGLFKRVDITDRVRELKPLVPQWVQAARETLSGPEPEIVPGSQCNSPYACPFQGYCSPQDPKAFPVELLPRISDKTVAQLKAKGYSDIRKIPSGILTNEKHETVRRATSAGRRHLDFAATHAFMERLGHPRYFMDFETINSAVPLWKGSRPYQQIPFQWSCHIQSNSGELRQEAYLATGETDPRREFAESLIATVRSRGPVLVYNAAFEASRLRELADLLLDLAEALQAIIERIVDLLPVARDHYYHPDMRGSWSIKAVLPTIAPELTYDNLEVADGGMAQEAFQEILRPETADNRREILRSQLLQYCERDTFAMVRLAGFFARGK
jgi:hypothetical protein